jgi:hypothetical protein
MYFYTELFISHRNAGFTEPSDVGEEQPWETSPIPKSAPDADKIFGSK